MSQSSIRKKSDPLYGIVPQSERFHGIIISSPMEINGTTLNIKSSNIDPIELRFSLLFWDKLIWPSSKAIYLSSSPDEEFLESTGILERPSFTVYGDGAQGLLKTQINAYNHYEENFPGSWSLAQGERSLTADSSTFQDNGGACLELLRAIPIPKEEVHFEDILIFKEKRNIELSILRYKISTMAKRIEKSELKEEETKKCIEEIDKACADLITCSREWQCPIYLSDMNMSFNFNPVSFFSAASLGYDTMKGFGAPAAFASAAAMGAASTININDGIKFRSTKRTLSPFRYGYQIQHELI
ncbi:hypothetical protein E0X81_06525 [Halomonas sp. GDM18]|nr:hypothetical protein E0X81_06525 [Halomonas sp. GDM18]